MSNSNNLLPLEPDKYYHIFNHANGKENLFVKDENYYYFLNRYTYFINPIADTFAYCLMPNHFHFAVRIKSLEQLEELELFKSSNLFKSSKLLKSSELKSSIEKFLSKQFSNLFSSYTQAFNKQQNRKGSLFIPRFRRKHIDSNEYFREIIHYIHYNPVHHGFVEDLRDWKYSSFETYFSEKATSLKRDEVIEWFYDKENFLAFHQKEIDDKMVLGLE
jgi:REP element-mobilizing transposase RayT